MRIIGEWRGRKIEEPAARCYPTHDRSRARGICIYGHVGVDFDLTRSACWTALPALAPSVSRYFPRWRPHAHSRLFEIDRNAARPNLKNIELTVPRPLAFARRYRRCAGELPARPRVPVVPLIWSCSIRRRLWRRTG